MIRHRKRLMLRINYYYPRQTHSSHSPSTNHHTIHQECSQPIVWRWRWFFGVGWAGSDPLRWDRDFVSTGAQATADRAQKYASISFYDKVLKGEILQEKKQSVLEKAVIGPFQRKQNQENRKISKLFRSEAL